MAQIMAGDIRKGVTFLYNNNIMVVVDFLHVKPGKGAAFVRTKLKNVVTGAVLEQTFNPTEKFELATIETKTMQYSYITSWIAKHMTWFHFHMTKLRMH